MLQNRITPLNINIKDLEFYSLCITATYPSMGRTQKKRYYLMLKK